MAEKKRIWITGSSGFIGKNLVPILINNSELHCFSNNSIYKNGEHSKINYLDYSNQEEIIKAVNEFGVPNVFIHLGWGGRTDPDNIKLKEKNVLEGETLIKTLYREGLDKFIFIGSCNEYGNQTGSLTEDMEPAGPLNQYSKGKIDVASIGFSEAKTQNKIFIHVRVFYVFGPGQHKNSLVNKLYNSYKNRISVELDPCEHYRDYLTVFEVVEGINRISDINKSVVLNLGSGRCIKMKDFVSKFWEQLGGNKDKLTFGSLNRPASDAEQNYCYANIDRLLKMISWKPDDNIELGISKTIKILNL